MSAIEHMRQGNAQVVRGVPGQRGLARQTARHLAELEAQTIERMAHVQAEGMVSMEKMGQVDDLAERAAIDQIRLGAVIAAAAGTNVLSYEEAAYFQTVAKLGKGQIIGHTVAGYCREGNRY